ncbi:MAG TPA: methylmalonyl Co-A mutase-associated GTPase MeaB [Thermomicrobiaceae bacterium]|nr:methylmalonyl Co-A mutase-associated GTPase MeaB [Thermomicrobiaceae bacterium]
MSGLLERFRAGDRRALARLVSSVENRSPLGQEALKALFPLTGRAHLVGVTGPPGAGKSTLVNALIREERARGRTVGVLAIDPSSTLTGGAALGDRIRMMENYADEGVIIRSMATRGQIGGLSLAVSGAAHLLDAFGFDVILIETVGVGQDEVDIADAADTTVVVQVPGLGDSIQTIKAGVLEIADILVVNKADRPEARQLVRDLRNMLLLGAHGAPMPPIVSTVASEGKGVRKLVEEIDAHRAQLEASGGARERRGRRLLREVELLADEQFDRWLRERLRAVAASVEPALLERQLDPGSLAARLVEEFRTLDQPAQR